MAASQPKNAAVNIIPSMPILTTPARSQKTPESAPRVRGVATAMVVASMLVMIRMGRCCTLPTNTTAPKRRTMMNAMKLKRFQSMLNLLASPTAGQYNAFTLRFDAIDKAHDRIRGYKEQDERLDH